jgi:catechol 2,3-dioxygenase-like lactoylglutathione lyase family enzyme
MTIRFDHIHIVCRDLNRMIDFFQTDLGARLETRLQFGDRDGARLNLDDIRINLRVPHEHEAGDPHSSLGYHHIGLAVDDLDRAYARLSEKGYEFTTPPKDSPHGRISFFQGPEGIVVEMMQKRGE